MSLLWLPCIYGRSRLWRYLPDLLLGRRHITTSVSNGCWRCEPSLPCWGPRKLRELWSHRRTLAIQNTCSGIVRRPRSSMA